MTLRELAKHFHDSLLVHECVDDGIDGGGYGVEHVDTGEEAVAQGLVLGVELVVEAQERVHGENGQSCEEEHAAHSHKHTHRLQTTHIRCLLYTPRHTPKHIPKLPNPQHPQTRQHLQNPKHTPTVIRCIYRTDLFGNAANQTLIEIDLAELA